MEKKHDHTVWIDKNDIEQIAILPRWIVLWSERFIDLVNKKVINHRIFHIMHFSMCIEWNDDNQITMLPMFSLHIFISYYHTHQWRVNVLGGLRQKNLRPPVRSREKQRSINKFPEKKSRKSQIPEWFNFPKNLSRKTKFPETKILENHFPEKPNFLKN